MTTVHVSLTRDDGTSTTAAAGVLEWEPTTRRESGDDVVLPQGFVARLVAGEATVTVAPSDGLTWCWRVTERVKDGTVRYVAVPDSVTTVEYTDLVDVDPDTLAAWEPTVSAVYQAALDLKADATDVTPAFKTVTNRTGTAIPADTLVEIDGAFGTSSTVRVADNTTADHVAGITVAEIADGASGDIQVTGTVEGLNTSAFTAGAPLYLGTSGAWTETRPTAPAHIIRVGVAGVTHPTAGTVVFTLPAFEILAENVDGLDAKVTALAEDSGSALGASLSSTYAPLSTARPVAFDPDAAGAKLPRVPLTLTTPDGSGQVTHSSVVYIPEGFNGYRWWLASTPYPNADATLENPCIWASHDGDTWVVPTGVTNPIEPTPAATGYNSDPHLTWDADTKTLYCFWRAFDPEFNPQNERIYYRTATEGDLSFGTRTIALLNEVTTRRLYSPAVHLIDGTWHMWAVSGLDNPQTVVHLTATAPSGPWSAPAACTFTPSAWPTGREPWHLDVQYHDGRYYALINDCTIDSSGGAGDLYFATSPDGLDWDRSPAPLLPRSGGFISSWYRSGMVMSYRDGRIGWDLFATSVGAGSSGQRRLSRTFITFDSADPEPVRHVRRIVEAKSGLTPYKIADTFNRADGAVGTADAGGAWTIYNGSPLVSSNKLAIAADENTKLVIDTGETDVFAQLTLSALPWPGAAIHLMLRATDTSNYYRVSYISTPYIQKVVAGAVTDLWKPAYGSQISQFPIRIGARISGTTIQMFINGSPFGDPVVDTTFTTGTQHGIQFDKAGVQVDDYYCRALVNGA